MSTILAHSSVNAFELARQKHQHQPYSSYAAAVAAAVHNKSDSDSETASSLGDDFSTAVAPFKPSYVAPSGAIGISTKPRQPPQLKRSELVNVFAQAMSFLPLNDINNARAAGPVLAEAASWVAPQPFGRDDVSFVRWEPTVVPHPIKLPNFRRAAPGAPSNFSWRCLNCSHLTFGPRSCTVCQAPINGSSCRVFLGQLRKDLTAEVTSYMLRSVAPELNILHVESHTNPADGRGRGCAWVYVDSVEDAVRVTELHKRIFVDVDTEGNEGFWFVQDQALVPALSRMADVVGNTRGRPQILPRQPMVAELPAKSIIADIVNSMNAQH